MALPSCPVYEPCRLNTVPSGAVRVSVESSQDLLEQERSNRKPLSTPEIAEHLDLKAQRVAIDFPRSRTSTLDELVMGIETTGETLFVISDVASPSDRKTVSALVDPEVVHCLPRSNEGTTTAEFRNADYLGEPVI